MRISDDERREVARRLREAELADPGCLTFDTWYLEAFVHSIGKAVELVPGQRLRYRLADLVDRPTCEMDLSDEFDDECPAYYRAYVCSNCAHEFIYYKYGPLNFCPNCGAEVVDDA